MARQECAALTHRVRLRDDRRMRDKRSTQFSLQWAFAQVSLCAVMFAVWPLIHTPASRLNYPPLLAMVVFGTASGALLGGFYRRFGTGAVIGFVTSLPAAFLIDVYLTMADWPHGN